MSHLTDSTLSRPHDHDCVHDHCRFLRDYGDAEKAIQVLRRTKTYDVPDTYERGFIQAEQTFLYQLVWDMEAECIRPLTPYPDHIDPMTLHFAGPPMDHDTARGIAQGDVDPLTGKPLETTSVRPYTTVMAKSRPLSLVDKPVLEQSNTMDR